jgi:hypothetical protein
MLRVVGLAVTGTCLTVLAGLPTLVSGDPVAVGNDPAMMNPDYRGHVKFDRKATTILMKIRKGGTRVVFQAREVQLLCDDGTTPRLRFTPHHARLRRDGTFDIDRYLDSGSEEPDRAYYRVHGRIRRGGNAHGFLAALFDPWDPSDNGNVPECATKARWKARPVPGTARP